MEDAVAAPEYQPDLDALKRKFTESQSVNEQARTECLVDRDYFDGRQLTTSEKQALSDRGQPDVVFNRVRVSVNGILGVAQQGKTAPRAYPRTPGGEDASDVGSKTLRYIADKCEFNAVKSEAFENFLIEGTCAAIVEVDGDLNIWARQIRWEEYFHDPFARRKDLSDKNYDGAARWMYADDVASLYPAHKEAVEGYLGNGGLDFTESMRDRPLEGSYTAWCDRKKRRVLVVEMYHKDGGWKRSVFFGGGVLESGVSPYNDDKGRPCNPIVARSPYVDRENRRMGVVRDMRGPQDEINKRRSKLLHMVSVSQIQAIDPAAVAVDADVARAEAARPDGVLPYGWQRVILSDMASGQASLLAEAKDEIERMGANPAVLGRQAQSASGRSQMVRQQAGMTELATLFDGIGQWEVAIYRQMWMRAKQFWTAPIFIRVTDDMKSPEFIGLNEPVMGEPQVVMGEGGVPTLVPTVLGYKNAVAEMDLDIVIDAVPDTANLQQEQFLGLLELAKSGAQIPPNILIEASSLPNKRELLEKLKSPEVAQAQAQQQQIAQAGAVANIEKTQSETALNRAKTESEQAGTMIDAFSAGHNLAQPAAGDTGVSAA